MQKSWVYFIEGDNLVKIGYSVNPYSRLKALQAGSPVLLSLRHKFRGSKPHEQFLHQLLKDSRTHYEWFKKSPLMMAFFELPESDLSEIVTKYMTSRRTRHASWATHEALLTDIRQGALIRDK